MAHIADHQRLFGPTVDSLRWSLNRVQAVKMGVARRCSGPRAGALSLSPPFMRVLTCACFEDQPTRVALPTAKTGCVSLRKVNCMFVASGGTS